MARAANEMRIPAIYPFRFYVQDGALLAYGFSAADQFKRAAVYASRIQKGEKAGDLPVQGPSLFEFGINLNTTKAMGLTVPQSADRGRRDCAVGRNRPRVAHPRRAPRWRQYLSTGSLERPAVRALSRALRCAFKHFGARRAVRSLRRGSTSN
jgi:hypothetical protein